MARRRWTNAGGGISVNTSELQALVRDLRYVGGRIHRVYFPEMLRAAAEPVKKEAQLIAKQHSQSIPPTIKVQAYATGVLAIKAGTKKVQLAALYEVGNAGGRPGSFKHPVFAKGPRETWRWVKEPQVGYPFLVPAAERALPEVEVAINTVVSQMTAILSRKASSLI